MIKRTPSRKYKAKRKARPSKGRGASGGIDLRNMREVFKLSPGHVVAAKSCEAIRQNWMLREFERNWNQLSVAGKEARLLELIALRQVPGDQLAQVFAQMGKEHGTLRGAANQRHVTEDWLGGYFDGPVAKIFLEGMIVGAQRSLASKTPAAMYWVAGPGDEVRVAIAESPQQTTFLLMTPQQPRKTTKVKTLKNKAEPLWVISGHGDGAVVEQVLPTVLVGG